MTLQALEPQEQDAVRHLRHDPTGGRLVAWAEGLQAAAQLATALAETSFVPDHFRGKPEECAAAILCGDELGLSPTQALRSIYVVGGKPALYARAMVALVMSHGHEVWTTEDTPTRVTVSGRRRGTNHVETVTWTHDRARQAGYLRTRRYVEDPQAMLYARASGDVARRVAPDVLSGVAGNVEELELAGTTTLEVVREPQQPPARTAKRKALPPRPAPEEPDLDEAPPPEQEPAPERTEPEEAQAEEGPPAITRAQLRMLQASYKDAGISDRSERLAHASGVIGRDISSANDLTKDEASRVLDAVTAEHE